MIYKPKTNVVNSVDKFYISVKHSNGELIIDLLNVENQEDWTNDLSGLLGAFEDIVGWTVETVS
jgi:hypothetical protein